MSESRAAAQESLAPAAPPEPAGITPYQPTGPYPQVMRDLPTGAAIPLDAGARGERIVLEGTLRDGAGSLLFDALIETWQADAAGRYAHPDDPRCAEADPGFWGYRRVATDDDGRFRIETVKPGAVSAPGGGTQAPHMLVSIFGGGILYRYITRIYFEDEPANPADPILMLVPEARRATLMARRDGDIYRFEIRLSGDGETVFFDV